MEDIEGILMSIVDEANKKTTGESKPAPVPSADSMPSDIKAMMTDIQDAMADSKTRAEASVVRTKADIDKVDFFTDIMVNSGNDLAAAQQKIKLQADIGALKIQEDAKRLRDAAGGVDFQVKQIGALTESQQNTNKLQAELDGILGDEFTGVGIIDDAINMFRVGGLYGEIDQSQRKSAVTTNQIQQLTQSQESFGRVNAQAASTINQGTIAAGQTALAAQASIDQSKAKLNQVFSNGEAYARLEVASGQEVKNLVRQFEVMNSLESVAVRREEISLRKQQIEADKELLGFRVPAAKLSAEQGQVNLRITKLKEQAATVDAAKEPARVKKLEADIKQQEQQALLLQNQVDNIGVKNKSMEQNVEAQRLNLINAQNSIDANPTREAAAKISLKNAQDALADRNVRREVMATNVRTGQALVGIAVEPEDAIIMQGINGGGINGRKYDLLMEIAASGVIAFDPATARSNLAQLGTFKPTKATRLLEEATTIQNNLGATVANYIKPKNAEGVAAEYNSVAAAHYKSKEINIATGDTSNPLHAPNFAVLSKKKSISGTALYQKVLKDKGMTETNPQTIIDAAIAGVLAKKVSVSEALAGIEAIFDQAAADNNSLEGGLARVGFDSQTTYNTRLAVPPGFSDYLSLTKGPSILSTIEVVQELAQNFSGEVKTDRERFPEATTTVNLMDSGSLSIYFTKLMSGTKVVASNP
tara:strand:+ start:1310 stop:3421 length:2112 start_codon:yes stop_codon:yes gene_type:complete